MRSLLPGLLALAPTVHSIVFPQDAQSIFAQPSDDAQGRRLKGRFLHITDIHPDPFYKVYSSTDEASACHHGHGVAGVLGAETTDCDAPVSLVNATFEWIRENVRDEIDFIVWTGDSARHDNDEAFPRSRQQVIDQNQLIISKFEDVFGRSDDEKRGGFNEFVVPIVPTFGNNDILPHNIFTKGPNSWTETYSQLWRSFIPEEQRHQFERGGWFYVEVIPNRLAVFSLNTMYFFNNNAAVDGCADPREPGAEHFQWLRIQLQLLRERGLKAIISGHVPPARTAQKQSWDETCWQKWALWLRQYRDVIVGANFGHINIEHFMLQDFNEIEWDVAAMGLEPAQDKELDLTVDQHAYNQMPSFSPGLAAAEEKGDLTIASTEDYLLSLREIWSDLPAAPSKNSGSKQDRLKGSKYHKKIGGRWAERFAVSHASASVVPNYFPTLRIFSYNISGMEHERFPPWNAAQSARAVTYTDLLDEDTALDASDDDNDVEDAKHKRHKKKKHQKPNKPRFTVPDGPSKSSPPGPAYSPQPLSWISYHQYFSNLTWINNDFDTSSVDETLHAEDIYNIGPLKWHDGKHSHKHPKHPKPRPRNFNFTTEYDTAHHKDTYGLQPHRGGLSVRNHVELAAKIGRAKARKAALPLEQSSSPRKSLWDRIGEFVQDMARQGLENGGPLLSSSSGILHNSESMHDLKRGVDAVAQRWETVRSRRALGTVLRGSAASENDDDDLDEAETETEDQSEATELDLDADKKKKKKHKKHKKHKKRKIVNRLWYAFVDRATVRTIDADILHQTFGEPEDEIEIGLDGVEGGDLRDVEIDGVEGVVDVEGEGDAFAWEDL